MKNINEVQTEVEAEVNAERQELLEVAANEMESGVELEQDTPFGEELDAGGDAYMAQYDDDPNPYAGTYSEE